MTPSAIQRFATKVPTLCTVCRRRAGSTGYAMSQKGPVAWICDNPDCLKPYAARGVCNMQPARLDDIEKKAAREGLNEAGPFLDEIGRTDLAKLTHDQAQEFCNLFVKGYEKALRELVLSETIPF